MIIAPIQTRLLNGGARSFGCAFPIGRGADEHCIFGYFVPYPPVTDDDLSETDTLDMENLKNYQLTRNINKRIIKSPQRLGHADLIS